MGAKPRIAGQMVGALRQTPAGVVFHGRKAVNLQIINSLSTTHRWTTLTRSAGTG